MKISLDVWPGSLNLLCPVISSGSLQLLSIAQWPCYVEYSYLTRLPLNRNGPSIYSIITVDSL